jgi:subtilisin family serine protease
MGFEPDDGLGQVEILSAPDAERPAPRQRWSHGEAVCRILGDLSAPESCAPIAPGADLVFANASYTKLTREDQDFAFPIAEADAGDYLDPRLVASFIYELAYSSEVDLINLSLGSFDIEEGQGRGVTEAIWAAVDAGVTVICSAGNRFVDHAAFPAEHPECIGVGAFGADDWGPENTMTRWYAEECPSDGVGELGGQTVFFWSESAHGEGVDVIGPGVGILMARGGEPCFELSGTSFAAPIVTGLMAVELGRDVSYLGMPRDSDRVAYVRRRLSGLAQKTGMEERYEGEGAVTLDAADF